MTAQTSITLTASLPGTSSSKIINITVNPDPTISGTPAAGTVGTAYTTTLVAGGGTPALKLSITSGALPAGLAFNAATGVISGTPTVAGTFNFVVQLVDSSDVPYTLTAPKSMVVSPGSTTSNLSISGSPASGTVGTAYTANLSAAGGTAPYTFSVTAGALPAGLTLTSAGLISGTPTTQGTSSFTAQVQDSTGAKASGTFIIAIGAAPPAQLVLTLSSLPNGTVGSPYTAAIGIGGGTAPYACSVTSGTLPAGLSLGAGCVVSGTPTTAGPSTFTVKATDAGNPVQTVSGPITITIAPAALTLTLASLPSGVVGVPYSATIGVSGGAAPYSCAITSGTLPAGLTLGAGCVVSGTPTGAGTANLTVKVTDSVSPAQTTTGPVSLTIAPAALGLTSSTLPDGVVGTPYTATVGVTGGTSPYSCSVVSGALSAGLTFGTGCVVSGTPTTAGTVTATVKVIDSGNPALTLTGPETITIAAAPVVLTLSPPPGATAGTPYSGSIGVTGGTGPYSCSITSGTLPAGLTLGAGCSLTGTPTAPGTSTVTVVATDSSSPKGTTTGPVTLVVSPSALSLTTSSLPNGVVGTPYSATIGVSGGTGPYSCVFTSGTLPAGLTLGANCLVSGTPTVSGTVNLTVKATDSGNPAQTVSGPVGVTIAPAALLLTTSSLPNGVVGTPYSAAVGVTAGTGPYGCVFTSGTLPVGLSLGANCLVSGTPTVAGTFNLTVKATDSANPAQTATGPISITIAPAALVLTITSLPSGMVGTPYSATIGVSGGTGPYNCVFTSGTLPAGLTLGANCLVSGTPTVAGVVNLTVSVTDSGNPAQTVNGPVSITVAPAVLVLTTASLPSGVVGTPYSATIGVSGGTAPYSCVFTSGTLPAGLTLGANCLVSGTPTVAGTVNLTVKATDSGNPAQSATGPVNITIAPAALLLTTSSLPNGVVGTPYTATIGVSGGIGPYSCVFTSGTLPAGLTLGANCLVSGTPTVAGTANLTVKATDSGNPAQSATGPVSITIAPATLLLSTTSLPNGVVGTPYSAAIGVSGGTGPYTCVFTSGTLPAGLTLGANCVVSGTPTTAGTVNLTVKATDSENPAQSATGPVSIPIAPAALVLTTSSLPNGVVGTLYSATIGVTGGTNPYSCVVTSGTLPAGLTLGANCLVSGTPITAGTVNLTVKATDSGNPAQTATGPVSITIAPAALILTTSSLPNGVVGTPYSATIGVTGGTGPYSCVFTSGILPAGLNLGANCLVTGTPTTAGTVNLTVKATDSGNPAQTATGPVSITIAPAALLLTTSSLPNGIVGTPYSATIGVSGGTGPYNCVFTSGTLPAGLTLGANCLVTGTPTAAGTVNLTVQVTDSGNPAQTATGPISITIAPAALVLTTSSLPNGVVGTPYSATIAVTGGTGPYTCVFTSGTLPAGLTLGANCLVTGTPTTAGTVNLTVKATDSGSPAQTATGPISITIAPAALVLTISSLPNGVVRTPYSATIGVGGGTSPYSCVVTAGTLPAGLTLGANCLVSGTPTTAGTVNLTVRATDSGSPAQTTTGPISITIAPAALVLTASTLPNGVVGTPYSATIGVSGGTGPYTCVFTSGTLPAGLTLGANCLVSGTPTTAGTVNLTVQATDSGNPAQTATGPISITIAPTALVLTTSSLPNGVVGTPYSATIGVSGGTNPYNCVVTSGTLPAGLTLGANCLVSGTPTTAGTVNLTVKATDSGSPAQTVSGPVSITIAPAALVLATGSLPDGMVGAPYSATIGVSGGTSPYSCTIVSGTLPAGLALGANCLVTGTPSAAGTATLSVRATDAGTPAQTVTGPVTITITPAALTLTASALPNGMVGVPYSATIGISGGTGPYSCVFTAGTLPAGLSLGANCVVSGTPTVAGSVNLTVKATDSGNPVQTVTGPETINILPATLTLAASTLPGGTVGTPYSATIGVNGGTAPYSCVVTSGTLPAGLTLGAACLVSGTPTVAGTSLVTVMATDSSNPAQTVSGPESITIVAAAPTLILASPPVATVGSPYTGTIGVSGGTGPYSCTINSGSLPSGLTLGANCVISGTPTVAGPATVTVTATDSSHPAGTTTGPVTITVNSPSPVLTLSPPPNATVGTPYTGTIGVSGGTGPYSCTINSGTLPSGLTLGANCAISGTPTVAGPATVTVTATDSSNPVGTVTGPVVVTVLPVPTLTLTGSLPNATLGLPYTQTLQAQGGIGPYTYAVTSGSLPAGLTLSSAGVISGTPTAPGASSFTVTATDSEATPQTASLPLVLLVVYPTTPNDPEFAGPYAFLFQGYDDVVLGVLAYQTSTVGSFTADGAGVIGGGESDSNHQSSTPTGNTVASRNFLGTYTIGADSRGSMTITMLKSDGTTGRTSTYAIALKAPVSPATISVRGDMIEFDGDQLQGTKGSGTILAQTTSAFSAGLNGHYAFGLSGDTPCLPTCTLGVIAGPVASVGEFAANGAGAITNGSSDANIASTNFPNNTLSGTYGSADGNGRMALTIATSDVPSIYPTDYAMYIVNSNYAFVMSTDKHSAFVLLAGTAQLQTQATFNNASMTGPYVGYENSPTNPGLVGAVLNNTLNLSTATIFRGTANAGGTCNTTNVDVGGTTGLVNGLTGLGSGSNILNAVLGTYASTGNSACTVASTGRGVLAYPAPSGLLATTLALLGLGNSPPPPRVFYLVAPNQGYFLETGYAGLGQFDPQTGAPFSLASLNGTYIYGNSPASSLATITSSGIFTADGAGHASTTTDLNIGVGTINVLQLGVVAGTNYVLTDATAGRYVYGTSVIYAISPSRYVLLDENPLVTSPSIALLY